MNQHRQNLLAIEQSFNSNSADSTFYMQIVPIGVTASSATRLTYLNEFKIDDAGAENSGIITVKKTLTYDVSLNLIDVQFSGTGTVVLNVIVNGDTEKSFTVFDSNTTSSFVFPVIFNFPLSVTKEDRMYFELSNESVSGAVVFNAGLLKMDKLII